MSFELPLDMTYEEVLLVNEVKKHMLRKLHTDRLRFIFLYVIELGHKQRDVASILGVHETEIARQMRHIRQQLGGFKEGYKM